MNSTHLCYLSEEELEKSLRTANPQTAIKPPIIASMRVATASQAKIEN